MSWDESAADWDDGVATRAYAVAAFESLQAIAERFSVALTGARVCDFGCGTGLLTEKLVDQAGHIDSVDSSPAMLDVLRGKVAKMGWSHVELHDTIPVEVAPFDLIVCSSVCAFLDDYPGTVATMAGRLRAGGLFVQWDWEGEDDSPFGMMADSINSCLTGAGLVVQTVERAFTVTADGQTMSPLVGVARK
jgi:predicted TPR repeat methyltransferase